jgi:hypothetical protein
MNYMLFGRSDGAKKPLRNAHIEPQTEKIQSASKVRGLGNRSENPSPVFALCFGIARNHSKSKGASLACPHAS